jgi:hypothetical protein
VLSSRIEGTQSSLSDLLSLNSMRRRERLSKMWLRCPTMSLRLTTACRVCGEDFRSPTV